MPRNNIDLREQISAGLRRFRFRVQIPKDSSDEIFIWIPPSYWQILSIDPAKAHPKEHNGIPVVHTLDEALAILRRSHG